MNKKCTSVLTCLLARTEQLCYLNTKVALPCTCVLVAMLRNRKKWQLRFLLCANKVCLLAGRLLKHKAFWNSASATSGVASTARMCEGEEIGVFFVSVVGFFGLGFFCFVLLFWVFLNKKWELYWESDFLLVKLLININYIS